MAGIDLAVAVGSEVESRDGRVGKVVSVGDYALAWTWDPRVNAGTTESVLLTVTSGHGLAVVKVVETVRGGREQYVTDFWSQWFTALENWVRFPKNFERVGSLPRPRVDALWNPHDPRMTELEVKEALRRNRVDRFSDLPEEVALNALLIRALASQGKLDDAEELLDATFSGFKEAPAWIPMLEALERGRIGKHRAAQATQEDELADDDDLWTEAAENLARCIWIAPGADIDLSLEAAWELATMKTTADGPGSTSLWGEFGRAVAQRAPANVRATWLPQFASL